MSEPSDSESLPLIGICAVRERARWSFWHRTVHLVADSYVGIVQRAGGLALILPVDTRSPVHIVDALDGLLLVGGADLDPASYGAEREPDTETTYPDRDAFEIALVKGAVERDVPVLGICRGMQVLNVAFGGTILQDIAGPDGTNIHRRRIGGFEDTENHVELEEGSLASRAAGEGLHVAHCHHHQAIDRVGEGLVISGRAVEDGMPEAIESADGSWVLGVQWHPEARDESAIVEAFVAEAAKRPGESRRLVRDSHSGTGRSRFRLHARGG